VVSSGALRNKSALQERDAPEQMQVLVKFLTLSPRRAETIQPWISYCGVHERRSFGVNDASADVRRRGGDPFALRLRGCVGSSVRGKLGGGRKLALRTSDEARCALAGVVVVSAHNCPL